uniref:F-box domain-containing protein n=1 Tax=Rhabditophanes sp. KR3021 TaxID=114890 RepID=A0AC35U012_9BILA
MDDDDEYDFSNIYKPKGLMKTLHRVNAHNLECGGLNNFTEAFNGFMTRVKFFSMGHLRRTYSASALEFMKYRKLLPMIVANESDHGSSFDDFHTSSAYYANDADNEECVENRKVVVSNISIRVSTSQCKSFFSKFGKVVYCEMSFGERNSGCATLPRSGSKVTSQAVIVFSSSYEVDKIMNTPEEHLKLYSHVMRVEKVERKLKKSFSTARSPSGMVSMNSMNFGSGVINRYSRTNSNSSLSSLTSLNDKSSVSWEGLPIKALQHILSYLNPIERIKVEKVSKNWMEASIKVWTLTNALRFNDHKKIGRKFTKDHPLDAIQLHGFLSRCGPQLKELDLSSVEGCLDEKAFLIIGKYCPNLVILDCSGIVGSDKSFVYLGQSLQKIQRIAYRNMSVSEKEFWYLVKSFANNLKSADFRGCSHLYGKCFNLFGDELEELLLDGCLMVEDEAIEALCHGAINLKKLRLNGCYGLNPESLALISRTLLDLEEFSLQGDGFTKLNPSCLYHLNNLEGMKRLYLDYNSIVTNEVIEAVSGNCKQLEKLSIAYCGDDMSLTSMGLRSIKALKNLRSVDLSGLVAVDDSSLSEIILGCDSLLEYYLKNCPNLNDSAMEKFEQAINVEKVDVSSCIFVTNKSITTLIKKFKITDDCFDAVVLVLGSTAANEDSLRTRNSRVVLDFNDTSSLPQDSFSNPSIDYFKQIRSNLENNHLTECNIPTQEHDNFDIMSTSKAFVVGALNTKEDSPSFESHEQMLIWAQKEAANLNLT